MVEVDLSNINVNVSNVYTPQYVQPALRYESLITIPEIIIYFSVYLIGHIIIGVLKEKQEKQENTTNEQIERLKVLKLLFKWWPVMCLVMIILLNL
jgi:hypothetical protein